jgi:hypothetical protein
MVEMMDTMMFIGCTSDLVYLGTLLLILYVDNL